MYECDRKLSPRVCQSRVPGACQSQLEARCARSEVPKGSLLCAARHFEKFGMKSLKLKMRAKLRSSSARARTKMLAIVKQHESGPILAQLLPTQKQWHSKWNYDRAHSRTSGAGKGTRPAGAPPGEVAPRCLPEACVQPAPTSRCSPCSRRPGQLAGRRRRWKRTWRSPRP